MVCLYVCEVDRYRYRYVLVVGRQDRGRTGDGRRDMETDAGYLPI